MSLIVSLFTLPICALDCKTTLLSIDERIYQAENLRAYIVQYAYDRNQPIAHETYLAQVTIYQVLRDKLITVKKLNDIRFKPNKGMEPEIREILEGGVGKMVKKFNMMEER